MARQRETCVKSAQNLLKIRNTCKKWYHDHQIVALPRCANIRCLSSNLRPILGYENMLVQRGRIVKCLLR